MMLMTDDTMTLEDQLTNFLATRKGEQWKSGDIAEFLEIEDKRRVALALGSLHKDDGSGVSRVDHGIYEWRDETSATAPEPLHDHEPHEVSDAFLFEQDPTMMERSFTVVAPHGENGILLMDDHSRLWIAKRAQVVEAG